MFKRVRKELEKQQIEDREIDADDKEERLAGVFSDSDTESDSDNSDDEQTKRYKKKARKELIKTINQMAKLQGSDDEEEEDSDMDQDEDDDSDLEAAEAEGQDEEEAEAEEGEELVDTFTCDICPEKKLKTVEQVNVHLKSKGHVKRLRYLVKSGGLPKKEQEEELLPEEIKAKIEAKKVKAAAEKAAKEDALKEKKEAKKISAKEKAKAHRKLVKQKKWESEQAAATAITVEKKSVVNTKKDAVAKASVKKNTKKTAKK